MKKQLLLAAVACYALCSEINAQSVYDDDERKDTLIINVNANAKVLFIGPNMMTMVKYNRADSLKRYLLTDLEKAKKQVNYPPESKLTHYLVHPNGKRRLKAEVEEYQEPGINLHKEIRNMDLNLPPFAYIIYDVAYNCELQIYVSDPSTINELQDTDLTKAIRMVGEGKRSERRFSNIEVNNENGKWIRKSACHKRRNAVELHTMIGGALLGSKLTPEIGVELSYVLNDRYSTPILKFGISTMSYLLSDYSNKEFTNFYPVNTVNMTFMARQGNSSAVRWVGVEIGHAYADGGFMEERYKLGVVYSMKMIQVGAHFFSPEKLFLNANDEVLYGFTVRSVF